MDDKVDPFVNLAELDKLIHEPARLSILTALSACKKADFLFLLRLTGLTKGNLSTHLSKLEKAKLIVVQKIFEEKKPVTFLELTALGKNKITAHWEKLQQLKEDADDWTKE
jgi:DNA-binding MarR family transcriptional regulator